jgi:hypothetical protein
MEKNTTKSPLGNDRYCSHVWITRLLCRKGANQVSIRGRQDGYELYFKRMGKKSRCTGVCVCVCVCVRYLYKKLYHPLSPGSITVGDGLRWGRMEGRKLVNCMLFLNFWILNYVTKNE